MKTEIELIDAISKELDNLPDSPKKNQLIDRSIRYQHLGSLPTTDNHFLIAEYIRDEFFTHQRMKSGVIHCYDTNKGYWKQKDPAYFRSEVQNICKIVYEGKTNTVSVVNSVTDLAKTELIADEGMFEQQDLNVIVFSNCELRFDGKGNSQVHPHAAENYRISGIKAKYDVDATCPTFLKFMDDTFANTKNPETLKQRVLELMGMTLISSNHDAQIIFLDGVGRNGKGTLQNIMHDILGAEAYVAVEPDALKHEYNMAKIYGKLMISCGDVDTGTFLDSGAVKKISGGDPVAGRHPYGKSFDFRASATVWMAGNNGLRTKDTSFAMMSRMNIIPFVNIVNEIDRDETLGQQLKAEIPGIVNLILDAYWKRCINKKFTFSVDVESEVNKWRADNNIFQQFAEQMLGYQLGNRINLSTVVGCFSEWCNMNNFTPTSTSKLRSGLSEILREKDITIDKNHGNRWRFKNLKILSFEEEKEIRNSKEGVDFDVSKVTFL